ncbi:hypothetical protein DEO72_LG1g3159 [Vigna unguiculata]|uniref:Uncharacterized protein n=1 Tax=Vigna unguiculata TaxID=3917 RepID=A0A4D6KUG8_VIGUN|nr:hypothetical protein DEO72_LG1g3159 [Vigna unguiculata]
MTGRSSVAGRETRRGQGTRVVVDGRETRRRQGARVVVLRGGGWTRDETAVAGGSRGGLEWWARRKSRREEETATTAAQQWQWQRQHERRWQWQHGARVVGVAGTCREWPEFAERNGGAAGAREEERGSVFEP